MINQYTREGNAGVGTTITPGTNAQRGDISGRWSDRPTITYTPMAGQNYSQSLLRPLPPAVLFFLVQSGWSVDRLLRITTNSINGLKNHAAAQVWRQTSSVEFDSLLNVLNRIQRASSMGLELIEDEKGKSESINIFFPETVPDESVRNDIAIFKRLLGLRPELNSFPIHYGLIPRNDEEIVVQTGSMVEILFDLSWFIDVPVEHIRNGYTGPTFVVSDGPGLTIKSSKKTPVEASVAIQTRDHWYYIEDNDLRSKTIFTIIQILMSIAEEGGQAVTPLISIGN